MHAFYCGNHPLKDSQKKMSALESGQMRCHCSVYQKLQDFLEARFLTPYLGVMLQFKQWKNLLCRPLSKSPNLY